MMIQMPVQDPLIHLLCNLDAKEKRILDVKEVKVEHVPTKKPTINIVPIYPIKYNGMFVINYGYDSLDMDNYINLKKKNNYLDLYTYIKEDILKTKQMQVSPEEQLELSVKNHKAYKEKMPPSPLLSAFKVRKTYLNVVCSVKVQITQDTAP